MNLTFSTLIAALSGLAYGSTSSSYKGINMRFLQSGGTEFKNRDQWSESFKRIKALPANFTAVRIYATQEAGGYRPLEWIIDASQEYGLDVLLGIYLDDGSGKTSAEVHKGRFAAEFDELKRGLVYADQVGAVDRIIGISVGNEDFHDKKQRLADVADMISKVQQWINVRLSGRCIPVGHTDTYHEVMNPNNSEVAKVADFLAANSFPFWENVPIGQAAQRFKSSMTKMDQVSGNYSIPVYIGETGWPTDGQFKNVQGSVADLQTYWNEVICSSVFLSREAFFYIDDDIGTTPNGGPHWGILDEQGNPKIDLACPEPGPVI